MQTATTATPQLETTPFYIYQPVGIIHLSTLLVDRSYLGCTHSAIMNESPDIDVEMGIAKEDNEQNRDVLPPPPEGFGTRVPRYRTNWLHRADALRINHRHDAILGLLRIGFGREIQKSLARMIY